MNRAQVELTVRTGPYGDDVRTVAIPIDELLTRELFGTVELSNEPLSLMLASPGMLGSKESAVTIRQRTFKMRRDIAEQIARAIIPELLKAFGVNDELDGYKVRDLDPEELAHHKRRGRLGF